MAEDVDPIEHFRTVGQRLWAEHGGTMERFCAWLRSLEAQHPERIDRPRPRRPTDEEIDAIVRLTGG
ncbi:MAG: hypothetical protein QME96_11950 [Myxococcota bacterium]|nr:hypothetical protein [Myxococcota bacterium]